MKTKMLGALALSVLLVGCSNKITGSLTINGAQSEFTVCRNGASMGFMGVELSGGNGRTVRLIPTPTMQAQVILLNNGMPVALPPCGSMNYATQNSTVNGVANIQGAVRLQQCTDGTNSVSGAVTFENCH